MPNIENIKTILNPSVAAHTEMAPERPLQLFFGYRMVLACGLALLFFGNAPETLLGQHHPRLFAITSIVYIGLILASGLIPYLTTTFSTRRQAFTMVFVDICAITLLMHASGSVESGLGMLIAVSIVAGSLISKGIWAELHAALASLAILAEQVYSQITDAFASTFYTQAGLLGGSFFAIAILTHAFARQIQKSEALASKHRLDLANLEQLNEYIIQHMQTGIVVVDKAGTIRLMNQASWYLLGMPNNGTGNPVDAVSPALSLLLNEWALNREHNPPPFRATPSGRELSAGFSNLGGGGTLVFLEDTASVTQQAQQMKLASLGRLTASIAHEIRNPLGAISHAGQLLKESPALPQSDQRLLDIISTNTQRVNGIIENVLQFSRRTRSHPEELTLKPWLEQFVTEYAQTNTTGADCISLRINPDDTIIRADPSQLRQILVILCDNAIRHFDGEPADLKIALIGGITRETGGPYLDISDNGPGIDSEAARQIFEPFFTTRNSGTGLGLYIARQLAESNRLGLEHVKQEQRGCCFRITFPGLGNKPIES